jgi:dihydroxyacetone kinase
MMAKHLINNKSEWAVESIQGHLLLNNSDLIALKEYPNVIVRKDYLSLEESNSRVALISGGGSGHEPAHHGYIGRGMLTAAVCGHLFASPSIASILAAIRLVGKSNKSGVLLIVKNYTGDRLNFGLASKRAQLEGIKVDWILVDEDVALIDSENQRDSSVGSRGLCGTVLIHKIAGQLAEQRKSLEEIKSTLEFILKNKHLRTLGVSLSGRVRLPGEEEENPNTLPNMEIELGLGIHGESGRKRMQITSSYELTQIIFEDYLLKNNPSNDICLVINNLGGLSNLELTLLANDCFKYLHKNKPNIQIRRVYYGSLMTSLNMNGFSLTILNLDKSNIDLLLNLLDAITTAPAWPKHYGIDLKPFEYTVYGEEYSSNVYNLNNDNFIKFSDVKQILSEQTELTLRTICQDLIDFTDHLNKLDSECGDGDCGSTLANISRTILSDIDNKKFDFNYPHRVVLECSRVFENGGGTLSILLALFTSAAAKAFNLSSIDLKQKETPMFWLKIWLNFMNLGINSVEEYGRAKPNQRSIVDPLTSVRDFINSELSKLNSDSSYQKSFGTENFLKILVDVAYKSALSTASMKPRVGRASYVDASSINQPDAGASGISSICSSIYKSYLIFKSNDKN